MSMVVDYLPQLNEAAAELITRSSFHDLVNSLNGQLPHTSEPFVWSTVDLASITSTTTNTPEIEFDPALPRSVLCLLGIISRR